MFETLKSLAAARDGRRIDALFEQDAERAATFSIQHDGLLFDYSKTQLDSEVVEALLAVAEGADVAVRRDAMFNGQKINETEGRAVLHTALRNLDGAPVLVEGEDVMPEVLKTLARMEAVAHEIRGSEITDVVNIGIGGSDLGPKMGAIALSPYHDGPRCHFVSNVDGADIADTLKGCNPETTLFIIASKTFTTIETMTNARTAWDWLEKHDVSTDGKFVALSSNKEKAGEWGIPESRVFGFEDWVGGRYSMWGPIGLSLMIAVGPEDFRAFLRGGLAMDTHFREAPLAENMPVMLALVGVWHNQVLGHATRAVLPYDNRLSRLPAYLQQLEMESNGKGVSMDGADLAFNSGPVVWGEPGTNGQHAFYQLIHQGTKMIPCDFLAPVNSQNPIGEHHPILLSNFFAQAEALMAGKPEPVVAAELQKAGLDAAAVAALLPHKVFPGNKPSNSIMFDKLDPHTLGALVAMYEHKIFVQGIVWNINSFDQWGVELGKQLAKQILPELAPGAPEATAHDCSTNGLINHYKARRAALG